MKKHTKRTKSKRRKGNRYKRGTASWKTKEAAGKRKKAGAQKHDVVAVGKALNSFSFSVKDLVHQELMDFESHEYLYFRNLHLRKLPGELTFPNLRVIDVSFNKFRSLDFLARMPSVRHIFASGNDLESFHPLPKNVETLCVSHNRISSFEGLGETRNLRVFAAQGNCIENFKGFPNLNTLDSLDLRNNPVCQHPLFRRTLFSCATVKKLNGKRELKVNKVEKLDKRTAQCARLGYWPRGGEVSMEEIDKFLLKVNREETAESFLDVVSLKLEGMPREGKQLFLAPFLRTRMGDGLSIAPFPNLTHHRFKLRCRFQNLEMLIGEDSKVPMTNEGKEHTLTVICAPGEYNYRYFFDGKRDKTLRTVKIVEDVENQHEGKVFEYILQVTWFRDNVDGWEIIEGAEELLYVPTPEDVGHLLRVELEVFRTNDGENMFSSFFLSEEIQEGVPTCLGLKILGNAIEGEKLTGDYLYNGGVEGDSRMVFYREGTDARFKDEYVITSDDMGACIVCEFTPVREDGEEGDTVFIKSAVVTMCKPKVTLVELKGDMKEGAKIELNYEYKGGDEGETNIEWVRETENDPETQELVEEFTGKRVFELSCKDVGKIITAKVTPKSSQEVEGEEVASTTPRIKDMDPTISKSRFVYNKLSQGQSIEFEADYRGGIQGESLIQWLRIKSLDDKKTSVEIEGATQRVYIVSQEDSGFYLGVRFTPIRSDGVKGETSTFFNEEQMVQVGEPKCVSLLMEGQAVEGEVLKVVAEYTGGQEGESEYKWFRVDKDNALFLLESEGKLSKEYTCWLDDAGHIIMCEYTPIRSDGERGKSCVCFSNTVQSVAPELKVLLLKYEYAEEGEKFAIETSYLGGEIKYEWYRVVNPDNPDEQIEQIDNDSKEYLSSVEDVQCRLFAKAQPIRKDGVSGEWSETTRTKIILPQLPKIASSELKGPLSEGKEVQFVFVLAEKSPEIDVTKSRIEWFLIEEDYELPVQQGKYTYTVRGSDVGKALKVVFTPCREGTEDLFGEKVTVVGKAVSDAEPVAKYVFISGTVAEGNELKASIKYSGGKEGDSIKEWFRKYPDGKEELVEESINKNYLLTEKDVNCKIKLRYTPVRADGLQGLPVEAFSTTVKGKAPVLPQVKIGGNLKEGEKVNVEILKEEGIVSSTSRWYRVFNDGNSELAALGVDSYLLLPADVGCRMKLVFTAQMEDGGSTPSEVETEEVVSPKDPTISDLSFLMLPHVGQSISPDYTYEGGKEGESVVTWWMCDSSDGQFEKIEESEKELCLHADLLQKYVKVNIQPVRDDGKKGPTVAESDPIKVILGKSTDLHRDVLSDVEKRSVTVATASHNFVMSTQRFLHKDGDGEVIMNEWPKKLIARVNNKEDDTSFSVEHEEGKYELKAKDRIQRDRAILLLRIYYGLSDLDLVEELFGEEFAGIVSERDQELKELQFLTPKSGAKRPTDQGKGDAFDALVALV